VDYTFQKESKRRQNIIQNGIHRPPVSIARAEQLFQINGVQPYMKAPPINEGCCSDLPPGKYLATGREKDHRSPAGHIVVVDQRSALASLADYRDGSGCPSPGIRGFHRYNSGDDREGQGWMGARG